MLFSSLHLTQLEEIIMKYFTRLKIYKASNVSFNPQTMEALSYDWWRFVTTLNGVSIFNNATYSVSTCAHQFKVRQLMRDLNLPVHITLHHTRKSLSAPISAILDEVKCLRAINEDLLALTTKPRTHKTKNEERRQEVIANLSTITELNKLT